MPKYAKRIALLAAFAMLCGCTGNTGSTQTSTAEAVQTAQGSAEAPHSSEASPAGETTADVSSQPGQPEQTEQPGQTGNSSGVSLISGGDSKYSDIFELNGTWCDVSELPFNVETYDVPLLGKWGGDNFLGCFDKKMYFTEGSQIHGEWWSENRLWRFDPLTGTEELLYDYGSDDSSLSALFANDTYVVYERFAFEFDEDGSVKDSTEWLTVVNHQTGKTVFDVPEMSGNIRYLPTRGVQAVYDRMYISAEYTLPEFGQTLKTVLTVELTTGEVGLYDLGLTDVYYGVGNVCFLTEDLSVRTLYGSLPIILPSYEGIGDNALIFYNMLNTYYPTTVLTRNYDVLGEQSELGWRNRDNTEEHLIGKSAFSVFITSDGVMNRGGIFCVRMWKYLPTQTLVQEPDYYKQDTDNYLLIGWYDDDAESARAALLDLGQDEFPEIIANNDCIFLLDYAENNVTMLYSSTG